MIVSCYSSFGINICFSPCYVTTLLLYRYLRDPGPQATEFENLHGKLLGGERREFFIIIATIASAIHFRPDTLQDCSMGFNLTNNSKFPLKERLSGRDYFVFAGIFFYLPGDFPICKCLKCLSLTSVRADRLI